MKFVTRKEWGAKAATCSTPLPELQGIAVHYSAAYSDEFGDSKARVRGIQSYHMSPGGHDPTMPWCDIAYNYLFDRNGSVFEGRGIKNRSAAQGTNAGNNSYIAICFLGADKAGRDDVTAEGRRALGDFILWAQAQAGKTLDIQPHSHFHSTSCPGDELRAYVALKGWKHDNSNGPKRLPKWFWMWNAWRLGEGDYKKFGPRNAQHRPNVPRVIPPWAWLRAKQFDKARGDGK
jgi:hypothetical protein